MGVDNNDYQSGYADGYSDGYAAADKLAVAPAQQTPNSAMPKLRELVAACRTSPTISTTEVLKVLYAEFPQLQQ